MTTAREDLRRRLKDESPEVRRRAVIGIYDLPEADSVEILLFALSDEDWRVRKEAILMAKDMADRAGLVSSLIESMIQENDVGLRNAALEVLVTIGEKAIDQVVAQLPSMEAGGKMMALEVLGSNPRDRRSSDMLIRSLADEDPNVRVCAAEWLGEHKTAAAGDALLDCLQGSDRLLKLAALQSLNLANVKIHWSVLGPISDSKLYGSDLLLALGRSEDPRAAAIIVEDLSEDVTAVRALEVLHGANQECAAEVEARLGNLDDQQIRDLVRLTSEGEPADQRAATSCLLWTRKAQLVPEFVSLSRNESLHRLIIDELEKMDEDVIGELEKMLSQAQGFVLASVIGLLAQLMDENAGQSRSVLFNAYLGSADLPVATAAAGAVARFGGPEFIPRLLELVSTEDVRLQRIAGHALVEIGCRHAQEVREALLKVEIEGTAGIQLCRVFEVVGTPKDTGFLASALGSPLPKLRQSVLGSLATVAGADAVDTISLAMTDEDVGVRTAAAAALARVGPAAAETIVSGLRAAEGPVKAALIHALGQVGHPEAPVILRGMCRDSSEVVLAALDAMSKLGLDPGEVEEDILSHPDSEVVKQGLQLLAEKIPVERLIDLLDHDAWDVRLAVIERLGKHMHLHQVSEALGRRLYEEKDDLVKGAISRALTTTREVR